MINLRQLFSAWLMAAVITAFSTACSSDNDGERLDPATTQDNNAAPQDYQILVTVNAGTTAASRQFTRAAFPGNDVLFASGDELLVWGTDNNDKHFHGALTIQSGEGTASASFSGALTVEEGSSMTKLADAKNINAMLAPSNWGSKGYALDGHVYKHNTFTATTTLADLAPYLHIVSTRFNSTTSTFTLDNAYSIMHMTFNGLDASKNYTIHAYNQKAESGRTEYCGTTLTSNASGTLEFFLPLTLSKMYYFDITDNTKHFDYDLTSKDASFYNIYNAYSTTLGESRYTVKNSGERITGKSSYGIIIPDGYTVTLSGVNITQTSNLGYAPIYCQGDATIKVVGKDTVKSASSWYPAIQPFTQASVPNKTLTIKGTGSLTATGDGNGAPGIGCIVNGDSCCGNIVISGGGVWAIGYGTASAIGTGETGHCGDITVSSGVTVKVTKGSYASTYIGGNNCGTVTTTGATIEELGTE